MPENYIAMFGVPGADEARKIVKAAEPHIAFTIAFIKEGQPFPAPRNNLLDRFMSGVVNSIFSEFSIMCRGGALFSKVIEETIYTLWKVRNSDEQGRWKARNHLSDDHELCPKAAWMSSVLSHLTQNIKRV